jgi:uncharacterized protein
VRQAIGSGVALVAALLLLVGCDRALPQANDQAISADECTDITIPALTGRIVDQADMFAAPDEAKLTQALAAYDQRSGHQTALLTLTSFGGQDEQLVGKCIGNSWALGDAERDDGILFVLTRDDKQMRMALGDGLEANGGDAKAAQVVQDMTSRFRTGEFVSGVEAGIARMHEVFP